MTTLERNADIVHMTAYAPLFAHTQGWQWRPDLIWFDNLRVARSVSYYVQQMYARNRGTHVVPLQMQCTPVGEDGLFASAVWDEKAEEWVVKVINTSQETMPVRIVLDGVRALAPVAQVTTLDCSDYEIDNTVEAPNTIVPQQSPIATAGNVVEAAIPAKTFALYRIGQKK